MKLQLRFILCFLSIFVAFASAALPTFFPVCFRDDPQLGQCIVQAINSLKPKLATGDLGPGFKIPPAEPLYIQNLRVFSLLTTPFTPPNSFNDVFIYGVSRFNIESLSTDINNVKFDITLNFNQLEFRSKYTFYYFQIAFLRANEGTMYSRSENTRVRLILKGNRYYKNGVIYIMFEPVTFKILSNNIKEMNLSNQFPNSLILGPIYQVFTQLNSESFVRNVYPDMEAEFSKFFTRVANQIANQASFDEMFPY